MQASEYQKRFKPVGPSALESHYSQLLAYRRSRRNHEFSHHKWAWEGVNISDNDTSGSDTDAENDDIVVVNEKKSTQSPPVANGVKYHEKFDDNEVDVSERLKRLAVDKARQQEKMMFNQSSKKPRNPKNRMPIPKPSKLPVSRSVDDALVEAPKETPLFIPYGIGNRDGATTFNVRSDRDVRPSALRAKRRRQIEIEQRLNEKLVVPARQKSRSGIHRSFEAKMKRETNDWQSEYANRFPSYEMACYRRSLANLTPRPRSAVAI